MTHCDEVSQCGHCPKGTARGLRLDRVSYPVLAARLAGLIFLLPIFAVTQAPARSSIHHGGGDGARRGISNGELVAEVETLMSCLARHSWASRARPAPRPRPHRGNDRGASDHHALNRRVQTALIEQGAGRPGHHRRRRGRASTPGGRDHERLPQPRGLRRLPRDEQHHRGVRRHAGQVAAGAGVRA